MNDLPKLFTVEVIADQLGMHPETIRRAIRSGRMGCYRLGGCVRISAVFLAVRLTQPRLSTRTVCEDLARIVAMVRYRPVGQEDKIPVFRLRWFGPALGPE